MLAKGKWEADCFLFLRKKHWQWLWRLLLKCSLCAPYLATARASQWSLVSLHLVVLNRKAKPFTRQGRLCEVTKIISLTLTSNNFSLQCVFILVTPVIWSVIRSTFGCFRKLWAIWGKGTVFLHVQTCRKQGGSKDFQSNFGKHGSEEQICWPTDDCG